MSPFRRDFKACGVRHKGCRRFEHMLKIPAAARCGPVGTPWLRRSATSFCGSLTFARPFRKPEQLQIRRERPVQIQGHNQKAAATWGSGGSAYDKVSESIADSIEHVLNRLNIKAGERVLDLATGTGWTARRIAQKGAKVVGVDIGEGVIQAARQLTSHANLEIEFLVGDAEKCDLPSGAYDVITSTCGVMFASRPEAVASELARLCRSGGRIGLTTWPPTSAVRRDVPDDEAVHAATTEPGAAFALRLGA